MKRPLRCRIGIHKYVITQDSPEGGRYYRCARCGRTSNIDGTPIAFPPE
ncbi:hypothetical protein IWX78_000454 [Mycetocola sp. CAN_C7]